MASTLQQILGYVTLTKAIQEIKSGIPDPFPKEFETVTQEVLGQSARYVRMFGQRRTARLSQYGASARNRELINLGTKDVILMHFFEEQRINPLVWQQLHNYEDYNVQRMGLQELARQTKEFVQLFQNTRTAAKALMLANGKMWWDADGNLLPTSSGAVETVDMGIPANNQNQLNGLLTNSFDSNGTDIPSFFRRLIQASARISGYKPKYAFYGINIPTYFNQNDFVQDWAVRNPTMNSEYLANGEIPQGLFGLIWIPVYTTFWEDQNGVNQNIFPADQITFTPEITSDWYSMFEGSYVVPTTIDINPTAEGALASARQVFGQFGYGKMIDNPPGLSSFYGDTNLPTITNPNVAFQATIKF